MTRLLDTAFLLKICWMLRHKASLVQREVARRSRDGGIAGVVQVQPLSRFAPAPLTQGSQRVIFCGKYATLYAENPAPLYKGSHSLINVNYHLQKRRISGRFRLTKIFQISAFFFHFPGFQLSIFNFQFSIFTPPLEISKVLCYNIFEKYIPLWRQNREEHQFCGRF